ncbi:unnamed protein product [Lactuca saligna]|uniref:Uncharacterized protein n=1 Tax=Lactuca saligna TaxID=75948 RepID=A0AA35UTE8_LACSI|nr:unnamed protein product [Lactuca saligna]
MVKLFEIRIVVFCISFLLLFVCHRCNKTETNDIKTDGFKPPDCVSTCSKVGPTYCCCGTCCTCDIDKTKCDKKYLGLKITVNATINVIIPSIPSIIHVMIVVKILTLRSIIQITRIPIKRTF